jgi:hypothetical protein
MNNQSDIEIHIIPINENCYEFKITRNIFTKDKNY